MAWYDAQTSTPGTPAWVYTAVVLSHMACAVLCILKGKLPTGIVGIVVPLIAWVGAIRLAKPGSWWARRRYRGRKLERADHRFDAAYAARHDRLRDLLGGTPAQGPAGPPGSDR